MLVLGLIIGAFVGAPVGLFVAALCVAASRGDAHLEAIERLERERQTAGEVLP